MLVKNLLHHAVLNGFTARFAMASDMLHELASQDSDASLARRLRRFTQPQLLAIDEVGYLNYDNRYADLLFEVVTRIRSSIADTPPGASSQRCCLQHSPRGAYARLPSSTNTSCR